jgi:hypothetical protein
MTPIEQDGVALGRTRPGEVVEQGFVAVAALDGEIELGLLMRRRVATLEVVSRAVGAERDAVVVSAFAALLLPA